MAAHPHGGTRWSARAFTQNPDFRRPRIRRLTALERRRPLRRSTPLMLSRLRTAGLADIAEKLDTGVRLDFQDGVRLFDAPDLLAVGWLANRERERQHGAR